VSTRGLVRTFARERSMPFEGLIEQALLRVSAPGENQQAAQPMAGLRLLRRDSPSSFEASLYEPVLCLILQGEKESRSESRLCRSARGSASS
jgi:hypothetical protein